MAAINQLGQIQTVIALLDVFNTNSNPQENDIIQCIISNCLGTNKSDIIIGSFLTQTIDGLEGNDHIQGNDGNDTIHGGDGSDILQGGSGFDKIFGQNGDDFLFTDATTSLLSTTVDDELSAINRFNEMLLGIDDPHSLIIINKLLNHSVSNNDIIADIFALDDINDILTMDISLLDGGQGNDNLYGQSGNEVFIGGSNKDYFDCNEGIDIVLDFNQKEDTANVNCEWLVNII